MQVAQPFVTVSRSKIKLYKRTQLRVLNEKREKERQERAKRAKLLQKKHEYEWQLALRRTESEEAIEA